MRYQIKIMHQELREEHQDFEKRVNAFLSTISAEDIIRCDLVKRHLNDFVVTIHYKTTLKN